MSKEKNLPVILPDDSPIKTLLDKVFAVILAICPILQHYKAPVYNAALTALIFIIPYLCMRMMPKLRGFRFSGISIVFVMIVYQVFRVVDHGTSVTELGQSGVFVIYLLAMALGCIDLKFFVRVASCVAMFASLCLMLQYFCFYLFEYHIQFVPTSLLIDTADQWILGAQTGLAGITGKLNDFYRPSAFFLEPSHFYIYSFPHLFIMLFTVSNDAKERKRNLYSAMLITVGLILCTSGMGIAAAAGAWGLFLAFYNEKDYSFRLRNVLRKRNLIAIGFLLVVFALMVAFVPTIRRTVTRIFTTATGVTAITGRVSKAFALLGTFTPTQWIIGVEDTAHKIKFNMPSFVSAVYRHGIIGLILSYDIYVKSLFKSKLPYALAAAVIIATSFFSAHTHATVGMLYYTMILICGMKLAANEKTAAQKAESLVEA